MSHVFARCASQKIYGHARSARISCDTNHIRRATAAHRMSAGPWLEYFAVTDSPPDDVLSGCVIAGATGRLYLSTRHRAEPIHRSFATVSDSAPTFHSTDACTVPCLVAVGAAKGPYPESTCTEGPQGRVHRYIGGPPSARSRRAGGSHAPPLWRRTAIYTRAKRARCYWLQSPARI